MRPEVQASVKAAKKLAFMTGNPKNLPSEKLWDTMGFAQRARYLHLVYELMKVLDYDKHYVYGQEAL